MIEEYVFDGKAYLESDGSTSSTVKLESSPWWERILREKLEARMAVCQWFGCSEKRSGGPYCAPHQVEHDHWATGFETISPARPT